MRGGWQGGLKRVGGGAGGWQHKKKTQAHVSEEGCSFFCAFTEVKKQSRGFKFQAGDVNGESSSSTDEVSPY